MPLFYFSSDDGYDGDEGLEFPTVEAACREAEWALRHIAAHDKTRSSTHNMRIWDENGRLVGEVELVVRLKINPAAPGDKDQLTR